MTHGNLQGTPRPIDKKMDVVAGLLAHGSMRPTAFPVKTSGISIKALAAYSCGGSFGLGDAPLTVFPFDPDVEPTTGESVGVWMGVRKSGGCDVVASLRWRRRVIAVAPPRQCGDAVAPMR